MSNKTKMQSIHELFLGRRVTISVENSYFMGVLDHVQEDYVLLRLKGKTLAEATELGEVMLIEQGQIKRISLLQSSWPLARTTLEQCYQLPYEEQQQDARNP